MINPLISIIVPIYNVQDYLVQCVESILNQTLSNFELILVDDGSTDNSANLCNKYANKDSRIKVIHKKNGGLSSARNTGIEIARGKYLGFVDSDDWVDFDMYEKMTQKAELENVDIVVCGHKVVNLDGSITNVPSTAKNIKYSSKDATKLILLDKQITSFAWNKIYRRKLFDDVRYPLGRIYEDTATTYKLFDKSSNVYCLSESLIYYRRRSNSICLSKDSVKSVKRSYDNFLAFYERFQFVKTHHEYISVLEDCKYLAARQSISALSRCLLDGDNHKLLIKDIENKMLNIKIKEEGKVFLKFTLLKKVLTFSPFLTEKMIKTYFFMRKIKSNRYE